MTDPSTSPPLRREASVEPGAQKLPTDLLRQILSQAGGPDLGRASMVCRAWNEAAQTSDLWQTLCLREDRWGPAIRGINVVGAGGWKRVYISLFCYEEAICSGCFKRSHALPRRIGEPAVEEEGAGEDELEHIPQPWKLRPMCQVLRAS
mmetsp:Transcript_27153/g.87146  ORF Transcript_27153/g.87146 Transcript_27153/m.87146 type:complete len:149 (+) Transcript_27153:81-527(+)